ncbi:MAG: beta-propeller domain-containing protein, partial [Candidatus Thermoplasmatota archaeon]|nr:beta-propeller domain-containing protein [Candidatus Thermoplasmatota archaeon]
MSSIDMNSYLKIPLAICLAATALTAGAIGYAMTQGGEETPLGGLLRPFSSHHELAEFLGNIPSSGGSSAYYGYGTPTEATMGLSDKTPSHSTTNVQVAGVDESDLVKTDGEYLYIASYNNVTIIKAYPPAELANVTVLTAEDLIGFERVNMTTYISISGIYVLENRLVVVLSVFEYPTWTGNADYAEYYAGSWTGERAMVSVFDINDVAAPELLYSCGVSGYSLTSRIVDNYLYMIGQSSVWMVEEKPLLPLIWEVSHSEEFDVGQIYYDPETRDSSSFMNLLALDVLDGDYEYSSILAGYASTVYMSPDALYLSIQKWSGDVVLVDARSTPREEWTTRTTVYKVAVDDLSMVNVARGEFRGWLLNQFSMDEKDGYLRVATTTSWSEPRNGVYVLDSNLAVVGALEGLAPTERIYSARFLGDTLYLVTFRQIDPFFVIDLSDHVTPKVLGELKIPGFSSYLHPVDDTHVIGIGSENNSVKISLYNVTDPTNPVEQSKYLAPGWSWSMAQWDHKAFLFDRERDLLVIPMQVSDLYWGNSNYWTGAYVFNVSAQDGISLWGTVG